VSDVKEFVAFRYDPEETPFTESQKWLIKKAAVQMAAILSYDSMVVPYPFNFTPDCKWEVKWDDEQRVTKVSVHYTINLDYNIKELLDD